MRNRNLPVRGSPVITKGTRFITKGAWQAQGTEPDDTEGLADGRGRGFPGGPGSVRSAVKGKRGPDRALKGG